MFTTYRLNFTKDKLIFSYSSRKLNLLIAILFSVLCFAQNDSLKIVQPHRKNTEWAMKQPYVILISADGFRHDYPEKYNAENIINLGKSGVRAKTMIPSYPSITGPNHYTLVTGLYPSHHGMVDNHFYDEKRKEAFYFGNPKNIRDGSWLGGYPIWGVAERSGMLSAAMMWVASDGDAGGIRPTYAYKYSGKVTPQEKVNQIIDWLKLPEEIRPHFITLYYPEVDHAGHIYGTEAPETQDAVQLVDKSIGELVQRVKELNLPNVNFVFVSDHGMTNVDIKNPLEIPNFLKDKNQYRYVNSQTLVRISVLNKHNINATYKKLKQEVTPGYKVVLAKRLPKKLHYATRDDRFSRMGDIYLLPKAPKIFLEQGQKTTLGKHGYNPYWVKDMNAMFIANGVQFQSNKEISEFRNVDVYPFILEILGLKPLEQIDGKKTLIRKVLK
ncbi:ectonucleotide pyrophosphatase/phosphodiesterase [Riemerella anatipestifer]|uniref:alkaline phosphatase family protein n=1 Tax=Riemerella anatipestifer TaxID=34085 RepID=UPI0021A988DD|nr:ectonucleotide pyrophosphatase/phosphodiesterase [Riemerella anatipestifer]MDY3364191.1 ectonucleotide pyrophosphatase/phosphodiesterase [Riemerella anatipestifer]MDY3521574.1 ectonucleotide pyrophosphatase/phosphodiesterase [Riemerella anatipestifer]MDY3533550.1 ectonucleotide pyrophosphatase/phosphodiesterase [Riemerella anatipestifer]MDY3535955.1 ectonucleotide pyrophosphatase/phosphodiesterase [Riemerella anatipestifer]